MRTAGLIPSAQSTTSAAATQRQLAPSGVVLLLEALESTCATMDGLADRHLQPEHDARLSDWSRGHRIGRACAYRQAAEWIRRDTAEAGKVV